MKQFTFLVLSLLLAAGASAQLYKWVDKDGKVQYTDTPPPAGTKADKTMSNPRSAPAAPASAASRPKSAIEQEAEFKKRTVEQQENANKKEKTAAEEQQRQLQCTSAKSNLVQLESGQRIAKYDEKGERSYLDDSARPQAIAEARKAADSWCNPSASAQR